MHTFTTFGDISNFLSPFVSFLSFCLFSFLSRPRRKQVGVAGRGEKMPATTAPPQGEEEEEEEETVSVPRQPQARRKTSVVQQVQVSWVYCEIGKQSGSKSSWGTCCSQSQTIFYQAPAGSYNWIIQISVIELSKSLYLCVHCTCTLCITID